MTVIADASQDSRASGLAADGRADVGVRDACVRDAGSKRATLDFEAFLPDAWNAVAPERRTPMQQHIWARAAKETLSPNAPVDVAAVGGSQTPLALAPFGRRPGWPARLMLLGAEELSESVEVVYRSVEHLELLAEELAATRLPQTFGHYLADTPFIAALRRANRGRGIVVARPLPHRACPSIELDRSWVEPESHFTSKRRSDFRRMQRTAEKLGELKVEITSPARTAVPALLDEALEIETRGWKGRAGTAVAHNEEQARFYRRYAEYAANSGILRLCFLRLDGKAVAMQMAVETEARFWLLKIGYDETFKRCSPGNLLLRETISYAAAHGLKSYEFLGKEADWTTLWTQNARPVVALRTYPFNFAGAAAAALDFLHLARQRLANWQARRSSLTAGPTAGPVARTNDDA